jgi:hypothetical protein
MTTPKPQRPSFVRWLRETGQISDAEVKKLNDEWRRVKPDPTKHINFTVMPLTWEQFVAGKYPRHVIAYQVYLRLIGVT